MLESVSKGYDLRGWIENSHNKYFTLKYLQS
jgi:hypothetical protein